MNHYSDYKSISGNIMLVKLYKFQGNVNKCTFTSSQTPLINRKHHLEESSALHHIIVHIIQYIWDAQTIQSY